MGLVERIVRYIVFASMVVLVAYMSYQYFVEGVFDRLLIGGVMVFAVILLVIGPGSEVSDVKR